MGSPAFADQRATKQPLEILLLLEILANKPPDLLWHL